MEIEPSGYASDSGESVVDTPLLGLGEKLGEGVFKVCYAYTKDPDCYLDLP